MATENEPELKPSSATEQTVIAQTVPEYVSKIRPPILNLHQFIMDIFCGDGFTDEPAYEDKNKNSWVMRNYLQLAAYQVTNSNYPRGARLDWMRTPKNINVKAAVIERKLIDCKWLIIANYSATGQCHKMKKGNYSPDIILDFSIPIILVHTCADKNTYETYVAEPKDFGHVEMISQQERALPQEAIQATPYTSVAQTLALPGHNPELITRR